MTKLIFPIAIALSGLAGCGSKSEPAHAQETPPVAVQTTTAATVDWPSIYEAVGTVRARTSAHISSRVMAYVRDVKVQVGDRVHEGETLAVLDSRDLEARQGQAEAALNEAKSAATEAENAYQSAQANLELAQVTYRRMKDLWDKTSISNQEYDEANAKLKVAKAALAMAASRRVAGGGEDRAGGSGSKLGEHHAELHDHHGAVSRRGDGEIGGAGQPGDAWRAADDHRARRRLPAGSVSGRSERYRRSGRARRVPVRIDSVGEITGRVSEIVPAVDPSSRAFIVKIDLPAKKELRPGMFGRARFQTGQRTVVTIPEDRDQRARADPVGVCD